MKGFVAFECVFARTDITYEGAREGVQPRGVGGDSVTRSYHEATDLTNSREETRRRSIS